MIINLYKLLATLSLKMVSESVLIGFITSRKLIEKKQECRQKKNTHCVCFLWDVALFQKRP